MKRRRRQLAELVGAHEALALISKQCSVLDACAGMCPANMDRARALVNQIHQEADL